MTASRRSVKREAMLSLLRSTKSHPSAEWVYSRMRERFPEVSLGTVYRNLRRLSEEGLITSVGVIDGQERFDANLSPHAHFVCDMCGAVLDLELPEAGELAESARRQLHGWVSGLDVRLHGLCERCLDRDTRA